MVVILGAFFLVRYPRRVAILLLIAAPLLLSSFQVGGLTLDNVVTIVGSLVGAIALALTKSGLQNGTLRLTAFPVALAVSIAAINSLNGLEFVSATIRYISIAILIVLVCAQNDSGFSLTVTRICVAFGAASVIVGQFSGLFVMYRDEGSGEFRTGGLMGHPNFAAYAMSLMLLYLVLRVRLSAKVIAECGLLLAGILLTGSLAAALTAGAIWAISLVLRPTIRGWLLAALGTFGVALAGSLVLDRLESIQATGNADSLTWRQIQWSNLLERTAGDRTIGIGWQQSEVISGNGLAAHSAYVQTLVELGIAGTVLVAICGVIAFGWTFRAVVAGLLVLYSLVASATDPVLFYPSTLVVLMVFLARERTVMLTARVDTQVHTPIGSQP